MMCISHNKMYFSLVVSCVVLLLIVFVIIYFSVKLFGNLNPYPSKIDLDAAEVNLESPFGALTTLYSAEMQLDTKRYRKVWSEDAWKFIEVVMKDQDWSIKEYIETQFLHYNPIKVVVYDEQLFRDVLLFRIIISCDYEEFDEIYLVTLLEKNEGNWVISVKYLDDKEYLSIVTAWMENGPKDK